MMSSARERPDEAVILLEQLDGQIRQAESSLARAVALRNQGPPRRNQPPSEQQRWRERSAQAAALATNLKKDLTQLRWTRAVAESLARRAGVTATAKPPPPDADGVDLRPDPLNASTGAELVAALRAYRVWAGEPPFRRMAAASGQRAAAATLCTALNRGELPTLDVVLAIVAGCGGSDEDQRRWATAWRRLRLGHQDGRSATVRELRPVPSAADAG
jgi:hypothetical protein